MLRENELLMRQLRKYVSAVQLLRRQGVSDDSEHCSAASKLAEIRTKL